MAAVDRSHFAYPATLTTISTPTGPLVRAKAPVKPVGDGPPRTRQDVAVHNGRHCRRGNGRQAAHGVEAAGSDHPGDRGAWVMLRHPRATARWRRRTQPTL